MEASGSLYSNIAGRSRTSAATIARFHFGSSRSPSATFHVSSTPEALRADEPRTRDILARIPAGHWGKPSDLAGAAVFLSSDAANYVHGTVLAVDGGWLAR